MDVCLGVYNTNEMQNPADSGKSAAWHEVGTGNGPHRVDRGGRVAHSHSFSLSSPSKAGIEAAVIPKSGTFPEEQNQAMLPLKN